jgi:hypothetical protein
LALVDFAGDFAPKPTAEQEYLHLHWEAVYLQRRENDQRRYEPRVMVDIEEPESVSQTPEPRPTEGTTPRASRVYAVPSCHKVRHPIAATLSQRCPIG